LAAVGRWLAIFALLAAAPAASAGQLLSLIEFGPEYFAGEGWAVLEPALGWDTEQLQLELALPLRMRLNPAQASAHGRFRKEDWDDLSDAGRALKRLDLIAGERSLVLHLGALAHQNLGHGTIVNGFGNALNPDQLPVGGLGRLAVSGVAIEALASDLLGPGIFGGGLSLEPLSFWGEPNDRLHLTATAVADWKAPLSQGTEHLVVYGGGIDAAILRSQVLKLAPYFDLNSRGAGWGIHAGLLADLALGGADFSLKAEWRRAEAPYQPEYFDVVYLVERVAATGGPSEGTPVPKAGAGGAIENSWRGEARMKVRSLSAAAALSSRGRGVLDASAVLSAEVGAVELAGFAALRAFDWGENPQKTYFFAEARYRFTPFLYLWGLGGKLYRLLPQDGELDRIEPTWQLGAGIGGAVAL
jgi:hypothetical protein